MKDSTVTVLPDIGNQSSTLFRTLERPGMTIGISNQATTAGRKVPRDINGNPLPSYEELIVQAIQSINHPVGCAPKTIFAWIAANYAVATNFRPSCSQALQKAFRKGRLIKDGKVYRLCDGWTPSLLLNDDKDDDIAGSTDDLAELGGYQGSMKLGKVKDSLSAIQDYQKATNSAHYCLNVAMDNCSDRNDESVKGDNTDSQSASPDAPTLKSLQETGVHDLLLSDGYE